MKQLQYLSIFLLFSIFFVSCAKEEDFPVQVDFSIKVINEEYSVPARVEIQNKTTGADHYEWTFEGANVETSNDKNPPVVTYTRAGTYKITLKASNKDGEKDEKTIEIKIDEAMKVDFDWQMIGSDTAPVSLQLQNKSEGAVSYKWELNGGNPQTSMDPNPKVVFTTPGDHLIKLTIDNGRKTYSVSKTITVKPEMLADFDWTVDFIDQDYEAPVKLYLHNKSTAAVSYQWNIEGATPSSSSDVSPIAVFSNAGTFNITLNATNDKETKTITKPITININKNLLSFSDIKLGINTAHATIGSFFSSQLGKVITKSEVSTENGSLIDIAYFGLDSSFSQNQFLSPDKVQTTAFSAIPNAISEKIINTQERVGVQLTAAQFDAIVTGTSFSTLNIQETLQGKASFNNQLVPRIVLIQAEDGRKGAIKIKSFVTNGKESYLLVDIKIQKTN